MTSKEIKDQVNKTRAEHVVGQMRERGIIGAYFPDMADAVQHVCGMIPAGSLVGLGGSVTVVDSGLVDALRKLDIRLLDRYRDGVKPEEIAEMRTIGMASDVFIASCNAITYDGVLVNEDGLGNRVAGMIYGPKKVILLAGMNKLVPTVEDGLRRIKTVCAPFNSVRFSADTPCARTGFCDDSACRPPARICSQISIIESNAVEGRLNVVLTGGDFGF